MGIVNNKEQLMQNIDAYLEHIRKDYVRFMDAMAASAEVRQRMIDEFNTKLAVSEGKKYIKVLSNGAAHSFIVKADAGKFKAGDILKTASWAAPATNFARGNVLQGDWKRVHWTGAQ